jgi:hypothetical protein
MNLPQAITYCRYYLRDPNARIWHDFVIETEIINATKKHFETLRSSKAIYNLTNGNTFVLPETVISIDAVFRDGRPLKRCSRVESDRKTPCFLIDSKNPFTISINPLQTATNGTVTATNTATKQGIFALCATVPDINDIKDWQAMAICHEAVSNLYMYEQGGKSATLAQVHQNIATLLNEGERQWKQKQIKMLKNQINTKQMS